MKIYVILNQDDRIIGMASSQNKASYFAELYNGKIVVYEADNITGDFDNRLNVYKVTGVPSEEYYHSIKCTEAMIPTGKDRVCYTDKTGKGMTVHVYAKNCSESIEIAKSKFETYVNQRIGL